MNNLNLDEFLEQAKPSITVGGVKFPVDNSFQALLSYQLALEKYNENKDEAEFSKTLGAIIFFGAENYEKVEQLIKEKTPARKVPDTYKKIVAFWMESMNLPINENLKETKKKTST